MTIPTNQWVQDMFTDDEWEVLLRARWHQHRKGKPAPWYRALRILCGYRTGSPVKARMETIVDAWLHVHPTWRRLRLEEEGKGTT